MTRVLCSVAAAADAREGTAPPADRWFLVEHQGPWGRVAFAQSGLPPAAVTALDVWGRTQRGRARHPRSCPSVASGHGAALEYAERAGHGTGAVSGSGARRSRPVSLTVARPSRAQYSNPPISSRTSRYPSRASVRAARVLPLQPGPQQ